MAGPGSHGVRGLSTTVGSKWTGARGTGFTCPGPVAPRLDGGGRGGIARVRSLGEDRAGRAANEAASGRPGQIARVGESLDIQLVRSTEHLTAEAVPGHMKAVPDCQERSGS